MLSRFISRTSHLRLLTLITSNSQCSKPIPSSSPNPSLSFLLALSRSFSADRNNNGNRSIRDQSSSDVWKISPENDQFVDSVFGGGEGALAGISGGGGGGEEQPWPKAEEGEGDAFADVDKWGTEEGDERWTLGAEEKEGDVFDIGEQQPPEASGVSEDSNVEMERREEEKRLEREEQELKSLLKGPNRAFGDLIAASGITNAMLDNLIALKDFEGVDGLPPLSEIEDMRYEKNTKKSTRAEIERQKQEEVAKARVRQVDDKGRAYGTGRRKCSIARVWVQPGNGNFVVNEKQFDVYFPDLDHRAALLRPFSETKTLGLWDVDCTVKGGGITGQVGAIRLGISRALQSWEPGLRPALREAGFLTRDPRVVERKKPGKAKARKSFQWVKR